MPGSWRPTWSDQPCAQGALSERVEPPRNVRACLTLLGLICGSIPRNGSGRRSRTSRPRTQPSERRWSSPLEGGWTEVLDVVERSIDSGAKPARSAFDGADVKVSLDGLNHAQQLAVLSWFGRVDDTPPQLGTCRLSGPGMFGGRHRTLAARDLGRPAIIQDIAIMDAVRAKDHDESIDGEFDPSGLPRLSTGGERLLLSPGEP